MCCISTETATLPENISVPPRLWKPRSNRARLLLQSHPRRRMIGAYGDTANRNIPVSPKMA